MRWKADPAWRDIVLDIVHGARLGSAVLVTFAGVAGNAFLLRQGLISLVHAVSHKNAAPERLSKDDFRTLIHFELIFC
ncbi:hypothetical protein ABO04_11770 [Nitrosomonas sp. HPC101]|nr:hypothetical protein [Nitrosomonas sp. HPC101]